MNASGLLRATILLVLSLGAGGFALGESYTYLMNPSFRWVTLAGAGLLFLFSAALFWRPDRGWWAVFVFAGFFALIGWAKPQLGGTTPMLAPPAAGHIEREGYPLLVAGTLFETLDEESRAVEPGPVTMRGFVKRTPEMDEAGEFLLLEPLMACCLADAAALGLRVHAAGKAPPEDLEWVQVFGSLEILEEPRPVPPFRVGAILFTAVSRLHVLRAEDVISMRALLDPIVAQIPEKRCSFFREALAASGWESELSGEGPYTVFAPVDSAFPDADRAALLADREALRRWVGDHVVRGEILKEDLFRNAELETLSGGRLTLQSRYGKLRIGGARLLFGDHMARNGVIHFVHPRLQVER